MIQSIPGYHNLTSTCARECQIHCPKSIIPSRYFRSDTANPHISSGEDSDLMVLDQTETYDPDRDQTSSVNHHHVPQPPKHSQM